MDTVKQSHLTHGSCKIRFYILYLVLFIDKVYFQNKLAFILKVGIREPHSPCTPGRRPIGLNFTEKIPSLSNFVGSRRAKNRWPFWKIINSLLFVITNHKIGSTRWWHFMIDHECDECAWNDDHHISWAKPKIIIYLILHRIFKEI